MTKLTLPQLSLTGGFKPAMINFVERRAKDYSRHNILKSVLAGVTVKHDIYLLLPFSKKKFLPLWLARKYVVNDFFISDYDTFYNDRKKGPKYSPSAIYKYILDWLNFRLSPVLLSDTQAHFERWQQLFGRYKGVHYVLPVLADRTIYSPVERKEVNARPRILFYGYFLPLHGVEVILQALKVCQDRGVEFEAHMLGEGQTLPEMLKLSDQLQLRNTHFNRKFISEQALATYINQSDIVLGIFGGSGKAVSVVPNKVYQALACGATVITQDAPGVREFFDDDDLCLVRRSPDALADAIEDLIADSDKRERLARQGFAKFDALYETSMTNFKAFISDLDNKI
jgi:glycosyltransferase involved in cell wall biosynthesis